MSEEQKDYYEILGIGKQASSEEINKAYKSMALEYHPDKNPDNKEEAKAKFTKSKEAYKILSDPEKRNLYNTYEHNEFTKLQKQYGDNVFKEIRKHRGQESYYDMLNVDKDASLETIKVTYKQTLESLRHFKAPNGKEIISKTEEAYKVLSNSEKRNLYDTLGHKEFVEHYGKKEPQFSKKLNKYGQKLKERVKDLFNQKGEYNLQSAQRKSDEEQVKESYKTLSEEKISSKLENGNVQSASNKKISK